jgi:hypothetical protein
MNNIPVFLPGGPNKRASEVCITPNISIYSAYTGQFVQYGHVKKGLKSDDPSGKNSSFHGIVLYPGTGYAVMH